MTLLTPLGLLGLLGIIALIVIYIIRPNYQQKVVSTTFVWKLSLKYRKRKIPVSKLRNFLIILCQILILTASALIIAQPNKILKAQVEEAEVVAIIDASASMRTEIKNQSRFERAVYGAIELAEKTFENDGLVSVVLAGDSAEFIGKQRATKEDKQSLIESLKKLLEGKNTQCTYGESDISGALALCEELCYENPKAQIRLFTDADYAYEPTGVQVVNVAESGEWNAAILNVYAEKLSNNYAFVVEVACYGASAQIDVQVSVQNANVSSSKPQGTSYSFTESVYCNIDEPTTVVFVNEEVYQENPQRYDSVYDVICWTDIAKISSYKTIHVELNEDDNFKYDDKFDIYNGQKETVKVQYASSLPNPFFNSVLSTIKNVYKDRWDIQITELKKEEDGAVEGFDFYIFEHKMPATMPKDGVVLLVNPDAEPQGAGFNVRNNGADKPFNNKALKEEATHPILKNVVADNVIISLSKELSMEGTYETLWSCDDVYPALAIKEEPDEKVVLMSFSLHYSNLPLLIDFPLLIYNMFEYFFPSTVESNVFEINEKVQLAARGDELIVNKDNNTQTFTQFPAVLTVDMPGQYELKQTTWANKQITENIFVRIPASESNITKKGDSLASPYRVAEQSEFYKDLMFYIAAAMTALLFIEWWLSSRDHI